MLKIKAKVKRQDVVHVYLEHNLNPHNYCLVLVTLVVKFSMQLAKIFSLEAVEDLHNQIMQEIRKEAANGSEVERVRDGRADPRDENHPNEA